VHERLDFMAVTGLNQPDFRTVSDFRKRHLGALSGLFVQVLKLCRQAGWPSSDTSRSMAPRSGQRLEA